MITLQGMRSFSAKNLPKVIELIRSSLNPSVDPNHVESETCEGEYTIKMGPCGEDESGNQRHIERAGEDAGPRE